ncbi:hypothetical protein HUU42_12105 [bacterium]|nr:hypothetical protein [bacterium]
MIKIAVLGLMIWTIPCFAQDYAYLVPEGWQIIDVQVGDLNKDQVDDVAMIVEFTGDVAMPPRSLIIAFKTADGYSEPYRADGVILGKYEGGTMGDPLQPMLIRRGTIVLSFSGGSRERWGFTYIFRYQKGDFQLIGATSSDGDPIEENYSNYDYNLSTGRIVITRTYGKEPARNETKELVKFLDPLPSLSTFSHHSTNLWEGIE